MNLRYVVTRYLFRPLSVPAAAFLARTPVTPIQVTWVSACIAFLGAIAFAVDQYVVGAALTFAAVITDCIDGDLARVTGRSSRRGAFLDSVLDRWMDAAMLLGLGLSDFERYGALAAIAMVGSLLTSYTRARAQSLGADCPEGIGGRDTRILVIVVTAVFGWISQGLVIVAVLGTLTSVHRTIVGGRALRRLDTDTTSSAADTSR